MTLSKAGGWVFFLMSYVVIWTQNQYVSDPLSVGAKAKYCLTWNAKNMTSSIMSPQNKYTIVFTSTLLLEID